MITFRVEITLGNDAMSNAWDVCEALRNLPIKPNSPTTLDDGIIYDRNGNRVGHWSFRGREN